MTAADVVIFWIVASPVVAVFFLTYGVLEDMIQKAWTRKHPPEQSKLVHRSPVNPFQTEPNQTPQFRGYDSSELFRKDALIRLHEFYKQVAQHNRNIEQILSDMKRRTPKLP